MRPPGQPPDTIETVVDVHATQNCIPNPPKRNIVKISREESNRRFKPDSAIAIFNYTIPDIKYLHTTLKTDTWYWEDVASTFRVYHFLNETILKDTLTDIDRTKMSSNVEIRLGRDIDASSHDSNSDSRECTTDDSDKEGQTWKTQKTRKSRRPKGKTISDASEIERVKSTESQQKTVVNRQDEKTGISDNNVKIHNHTLKSGNPLYLKSILTNYKIPFPTKQFYSHKLKLTTLQFHEKQHVLLFLEKVPPSMFGDKASYELYRPARTETVPRNATQDWNAVIRGVDPDINLDDFNKELTEHGIKFRRTTRITTPNGDKTHMIRIYFDDEDSAKNAIFNGITILGRRFRVEPPRIEARHIPCRKCAQYGHSIKECKNNAVCIRCGGKPGACTHPSNANIMFCATCSGNDHYTGQVRCRLYPRSSAPPDQPRQMPLPAQKIQSPTRPSTTDFPALTQSVWTRNPLTTKPTEDRPVATPTNTPCERSLSVSLEERLEAAMTKAMQVTMTKLEAYIDARLTTVLDQVIKFTLTVINNTVKPTHVKNIQTTANNTAKKLWRKRVQMVPLKNTIDVMISDMKENIRQDLCSITKNTMTVSPSSPTNKHV